MLFLVACTASPEPCAACVTNDLSGTLVDQEIAELPFTASQSAFVRLTEDQDFPMELWRGASLIAEQARTYDLVAPVEAGVDYTIRIGPKTASPATALGAFDIAASYEDGLGTEVVSDEVVPVTLAGPAGRTFTLPWDGDAYVATVGLGGAPDPVAGESARVVRPGGADWVEPIEANDWYAYFPVLEEGLQVEVSGSDGAWDGLWADPFLPVQLEPDDGSVLALVAHQEVPGTCAGRMIGTVVGSLASPDDVDQYTMDTYYDAGATIHPRPGLEAAVELVNGEGDPVGGSNDASGPVTAIVSAGKGAGPDAWYVLEVHFNPDCE